MNRLEKLKAEETEAKTATCPKCSAAPGMDCRNGITGEVGEGFHRVRLDAARRDETEIDFENDAREYLIRSALAYLAADDLEPFIESGEGRRVAGILAEHGAPDRTKARVKVAIVDFHDRIEAEARNATTPINLREHGSRVTPRRHDAGGKRSAGKGRA